MPAINLPFEAISFDEKAFDQQIDAYGVDFTHFAAMRCPVGLTDINDSRQSHYEHSDCSNGFIYNKSGELRAVFTNNPMSTGTDEVGLLDNSTVMITLPRAYSDSDKSVVISPFDRFYLKDDVTRVVNWELVEAHITGSDRLQFPAVEVESIVDSNGRSYSPNDYILDHGAIKWLTQNRPGYDPVLRKGVIYTIRYKYMPFWYVRQVMHEVRVFRKKNLVTGESTLIRMPVQALLQREISFQNENRDENGNLVDSRDAPAPRQSSMGPR